MRAERRHFAAVGGFAWAGYNGGDGWVFDEVDGRALFDTLFVKAKVLYLPQWQPAAASSAGKSVEFGSSN